MSNLQDDGFIPDSHFTDGDGFVPDNHPLSKSLAEKISSIITPQIPKLKGNILQRTYGAVKEQYAPTVEGIKRLFSPQVGQFGISRLAQEEGEKLHGSVSSIAPKTAEMLPPITPRTAGEQIGYGFIGEIAFPVSASAVDKTVIAPLQQLMTGVPSKEWLRLSGRLKTLRPSFLGGAPNKEIAGQALKTAEEASGMFKSGLPSGFNKEYAQKFLDTIKKYTPSGTERRFTEKELSDQKIVNSLIEELTPQETFNLRQAVTNTLDEWVPGKRSTEYYQFSALKDSLNKHIEKLAPLVRKAQAVYSDSAQRSKFLSLFPRTKYGEPAVGRIVGNAVASGIAGATAWGDPVEMAKRAAGALLISSPITHAGARTVGTLLRRTSPVSARTFSQILKDNKEKRAKQ